MNVAIGAGTITLSTPQDIHTAATPTVSRWPFWLYLIDSPVPIGNIDCYVKSAYIGSSWEHFDH